MDDAESSNHASIGSTITSGSPPLSPIDGSHRRKRAALAAQACETCRARKSRCDELRPQCSLCARLNVECRYREPVPTKKDKSIEVMMDQLNRMDLKMDAVLRAVGESDAKETKRPRKHPSSSSAPTIESYAIRSGSRAQLLEEMSPAADARFGTPSFFHTLPASQKVVLWPAVIEHIKRTNDGALVMVDLNQLRTTGAPWFLGLDHAKHPDALPTSASLTAISKESDSSEVPQRVVFAEFTDTEVRKYVDTYFDTYNVLYPILERREFIRDVLTEVHDQGFGYGDFNSIMALLVLALGKMGYDGSWSQAINMDDEANGGIRGGSARSPPGLEIFNEARKRLGFVHAQCTLESCQVWLLFAVYYEACCRHLEFWRSHVSASLALHVVLKCETYDWDSPRGSALRRVYWTCNLMENWYHLDLDFPKTDISDYEDIIPPPGIFRNEADEHDEDVKLQFLAMIALCKVVARIHNAVFQAPSSSAETQDRHATPPVHIIAELRRQVENWRQTLPPSLQWRDGARFDLAGSSTYFNEDRGDKLSKPGFDGDPRRPLALQDALAMGAAQLRSRYYYTVFLLYRPFVYKALHFPNETSVGDQTCAAHCLQACLLWPIAMHPPKNHKRLVPYLFAWTHTFLGILLILRATTQSWLLQDIADNSLGKAEVEETVVLLLDWMKDMSQIDGVAEWGWDLVRPLFDDVLTE